MGLDIAGMGSPLQSYAAVYGWSITTRLASILDCVRELVRQNRGFFLFFALGGVAVRLAFVYLFPHHAGDSLLYVDIAQNWVHHGTYALTENGVPVPTLIRLPGY